jgi:hypothetical protein
LTHVEREVEVDLHHNLLMNTARLKPPAALLLQTARAIANTRLSVLAPVDMVLHAATHLFYGSAMDDALRELFDIHDLLHHYAEHEPQFWQQFWPRARQLDLERPAFYALRYASSQLGTAVSQATLVASSSGAPPRSVLWLMDRLVPYALFPPHPDQHSYAAALARLLLYVRSHWIRMPPLMLVRHLCYKAYRRYGRRNNTGA